MQFTILKEETQEEVWMDIPGYEGQYQVSDQGRVKSTFKGINSRGISFSFKEHILSQCTASKYLFVCLRKNLKSKNMLVHRLVALAFLGENKLDVDHIDGNRFNNKLSNLRYCSRRENCTFGAEKRTSSSSTIGTILRISAYTGIKKFESAISFKKTKVYIGRFDNEKLASDSYSCALKLITDNPEMEVIDLKSKLKLIYGYGK